MSEKKLDEAADEPIDPDESSSKDEDEDEPGDSDESPEDEDDEIADGDEETADGEKEIADGDEEPSLPASSEQEKTAWADRWWVWALGGLAFAAFIGLLHLISSGSSGN